MNPESLAPMAAIFVTLTSLVALIANDWRISIGALTTQYLAVFALIVLEWPFTLAIIKLVAGWMASAVLGMAMLSLPGAIEHGRTNSSEQKGAPYNDTEQLPAMSSWFYSLAAILAWLVAFSQMPNVIAIIPGIQIAPAWGGLILIFTGLLKLSYANRPLHVTLGLLTALAGFEILLAPLDKSPMTAGLFAVITLITALMGAYLLIAPQMEENS